MRVSDDLMCGCQIQIDSNLCAFHTTFRVKTGSATIRVHVNVSNNEKRKINAEFRSICTSRRILQQGSENFLISEGG